MNLIYRMTGPVCGTCDHRHTKITAAAECADRFARVCDTQGVYCDRRLVAWDGPNNREPTEAERRVFSVAIENLKNRRRQMPAA